MKKVRIQHKEWCLKPRYWNMLKKQAMEFCSNTGLHGYKYISQTERPKTERIIWAIIVFTSLCCAISLMKMSWNYYATHPTLTVIKTTHYGIWNYPFPAITVCNINRVSYNLSKEFVKKLRATNVSTEFLIKEMRLMNELLIPGIFGYDVQKNLTRLQNIIDDNNMSVFDVAKMITQNCSTLLSICKWKGIIEQCDKLFQQTMARDGLCCSFNYYPFPNTIPENTVRSAACGFETGMTITINPEPNDYHATIMGAYGVKVMIHYSFDYPDFNAEIQLVRLNSEHFLNVNPVEMYSKPGVKSLAVATRRCIFKEEANEILYPKVKERNLTYAEYSYHNCLAECRATFARTKCGCIPYYFPQNGTRVCDLRDVECLRKYKSFFDSSWPNMDQSKKNKKFLVESSKRKIRNIKMGPCGCIPDCSLYYYPIESSFGELESTVYYNASGFSTSSRSATSIKNHSVIHVFFNDLVGFQYQRSVNYSWRNLFASFGGLLGLFAGFSIMSVFELLYYFVIRMIIETW